MLRCIWFVCVIRTYNSFFVERWKGTFFRTVCHLNFTCKLSLVKVWIFITFRWLPFFPNSLMWLLCVYHKAIGQRADGYDKSYSSTRQKSFWVVLWHSRWCWVSFSTAWEVDGMRVSCVCWVGNEGNSFLSGGTVFRLSMLCLFLFGVHYLILEAVKGKVKIS